LEQQKAARVAELEPVLAERVREVRSLSEAKTAAEGQLATAAEALRRVEAAHRETREHCRYRRVVAILLLACLPRRRAPTSGLQCAFDHLQMFGRCLRYATL
jgi:hypothetical protein